MTFLITYQKRNIKHESKIPICASSKVEAKKTFWNFYCKRSFKIISIERV